ncbi:MULTISPECIES: aspartate carbamoyltransferase catalytic subunit [Anaeromyxobacter]|uniref:aspartate carbamoyltransferase catalytic subunit n=1 Tax=Anaeromyxobacter TaxID=161492 RepID=UPI001F58C98F|nr:MULTISPECIES: aspartate carbamoyltransferase catalytic subunit [unclassified Anaeromyxobacter]
MIGRHKHCIALADYSRAEILEVLDLAVSMKEVLQRPIKKVPSLRGKSVVNLFFEASTRTRSSFEIAAKVLSADALNWTSSSSSVTKGETLIDTARNLEAMRPDVLVIRHSAGGAPQLVAEHVGCAVVSAGDGAHEHPSQGLLDCFTLREKLGTLEGKTVAIVGDISHSRVARSDIHAMTKLGARVRLCGPPTMIPAGVEALGATVHYGLREAIEGADAVVMLRIQHERIGDPLIPGTREYSKLWGLNAKKAAEWLRPECVILHPGPINRGVELSPEVADGPQSVILDQVQNGVAVRMAILYLLAGGNPAESGEAKA